MELDFTPINAKAPPTPSKWDIIPIHSSDRASFKFCRRQWKWSSPNQLNLIPRASVNGVNKNLWFGTGIHYALERYYSPVMREDPIVSWETWFDIQWHGGVIAQDELKQFADRFPQYSAHTNEWRVEGLKDILPDGYLNEDEWLGLRELGSGMMKFYKDYSEANDNFNVILTEHDFSVPVLDANGAPLYMVDKRVMPEGYEPTQDGNEFGPYVRGQQVFDDRGLLNDVDPNQYEKQVHVRGRMDVIVQEQEYGRYGIRDYKTASRVGDDYFRHLELDEQCTSYLSFGQLEARINNLEFKDLEFIDYVALLKAYPKPPTILKNGLPSTNRTEETTTAAMFEAYIVENGLKPIFDVDEKLQRYYQHLLDIGDSKFIKIETAWRNHAQRQNAQLRLYYEAIDMLSDPVPYPNPSKNYACLNCAFRVPCIQAETGDDFMQTLEDGYVPNWDR